MEYHIQSQKGLLGVMVSTCPSADVFVTRTDIFELDNKHKQADIVCLDGILWITQNNDPQDYFIKKGQTFNATHNGKVLIQGLPRGKARVSVK